MTRLPVPAASSHQRGQFDSALCCSLLMIFPLFPKRGTTALSAVLFYARKGIILRLFLFRSPGLSSAMPPQRPNPSKYASHWFVGQAGVRALTPKPATKPTLATIRFSIFSSYRNRGHRPSSGIRTFHLFNSNITEWRASESASAWLDRAEISAP